MSTGALEAPPDQVLSRGARSATLPRAAGFLLGYTLFVILFGAVVRVTGSGAGCGQHWPTCHGEVLHLPTSLETAIEITHRVTSGALMLMVVGVSVLAFRTVPPGHPLRALSSATVALTVVEALIGAGLVLLELVGRDDSLARAVVMPAHLLNTFALTAAMTALWVRASEQAAATPAAAALADSVVSTPPGARMPMLAAAAALLVVSATGAVTALGDTVYPPAPGELASRLARDHAAGAHFLEQLRIVHPVLAVLGGALVAWAAARLSEAASSPRARRASRAVVSLVVVQIFAGAVNVLLSAPGWLQIVHLGLALVLWIRFVELSTLVRRAERSPAGA